MEKVINTRYLENSMVSKATIIIAIIFLSTCLVAASEPFLGTYKQNNCITLIQTCANCTFNNITSVIQPNSTIVLTSVSMTRLGTEYSYNFCSTSVLGTYWVNGLGDPDATNTAWNYYFNITTTGDTTTLTLIILMMLIGLGLFLMGLFLRNEIGLYLIFISGVAFIAIGVYVMIYGLGTSQDLYTRTIAFIAIGLGLFFSLASAYQAIESTGGWISGASDDD